MLSTRSANVSKQHNVFDMTFKRVQDVDTLLGRVQGLDMTGNA